MVPGLRYWRTTMAMSLEELERDYSGLRERVNAARGYL